ncbi:GLUG motif-containing protein [Burkholderia sp. BE12]|uniref:GLUG motif-containing protein n=1 Tax=Burkholderia sp. BE12 TaxID=2082394 RepID=UPI002D787674|nr:GLUG motif-containing protein [Burkholderia sp. BE12]
MAAGQCRTSRDRHPFAERLAAGDPIFLSSGSDCPSLTEQGSSARGAIPAPTACARRACGSLQAVESTQPRGTTTMNKTYALVWNHTQGTWTAVGETARRHGKSGGKRIAAAAVLLLGCAALPAFALPTGAEIAAGKADIAQSGDGRTVTINQHTDKLITNWQDFSVAGGERVTFAQPNAMSIALNRVIGNRGSQIDGQISANGRVFLVNPNGVLFGAGSQVNVGGLVASTQGLSDANFLAGNYRFAGTSGQSVANDGTIVAADGGSVALLGARVSNNGVIQARLGNVALVAGNAVSVNFDGNGLLSVQVDGGAVDAQVRNGGLLKADGGEVLMSARAAGDLLGAVVNNTGTIEARGLSGHGGRITLDGGAVNVGGRLDASAAEGGAPAGTVTTRGERVDVADGVQVDTRSGNAAGKWTIEAANAGVNGANVAGRSIGADTLSRSLGTTSVELANTQGDLMVGGPVSWTSDNALVLASRKGNVNLQQALSATGEKASLRVDAANGINVNDAVKLTGRDAHLELNAKNGHTLGSDKAVVTLSGDSASYRSNGEDYQVLHTLDGLRKIDTNLNGRYVLGNAIDGGNASFRSIGGGNGFAGVFDGLGNTLSRLNISNPGQGPVGLFAANSGRIANVTLQGIRAAATASATAPLSIGALAGVNFGTISNVNARDVVVAGQGVSYVGGLVGSNISGTIDRARVSGRVEGDRGTRALGGLVGENVTAIWPKSQAAKIANSHADVRVVAALDGAAGGLVGVNAGAIEYSSNAGSVVANGDKALVGGLAGLNTRGGTIVGSSSSASVTARQNAVAGGLVGLNDATIAQSRATGAVTVGDKGIAGGLVGVNNANVDASSADGVVVAGVSGQVGGLAGLNRGSIAASVANGNVKAGASSWAGGLVGFNEDKGAISASTAAGTVVAAANSAAGGLVGRNLGTIEASTASGDVTVTGKGTLGGLVGENGGSIHASTAEGHVKASDESTAGGLAGVNSGVVTASAASGNVDAGNRSAAGGLVGTNFASVKSSSADGNVRAGSGSRVGGLIGLNTGTVVASAADGKVTAGNLSDAGGLIGYNQSGRIAQSSASGDVQAGDNSQVGGLIGTLMGSVDGSSATGSVNGGAMSRVGGLVGSNGGNIVASSSSGTVSGGRDADLGGLVGGNFGYVSRSATSSRIAFVNGYGQRYGALAALNFRSLIGNSASGSGAGVPLVGSNLGIVKN